ncbi:MAG: NUDIX hydrolase [Lentisphaeraceae bacterium]|nr:NUDIX hydrolase [Lentisphaeraceae bacterium]
MEKWQEKSSETIFSSKVVNFKVAKRVNPRNNIEGDFYITQFPDWVNVIAITPNEQVVLIRQYRHGSEKFEIELPGGCIEPNEKPTVGGLRELEEETGYIGNDATVIGSCNPNPAIQNNTCFTLLVESCYLQSQPSPDEGEDIEVFTVPISDLNQLIQNGNISNSLIISAISFYHLFKNK